jgi:hypothetical protein
MTQIETLPGSGTLADTTLSVYGTCGGAVQLCDDDAGVGFLSRIVAPLTPGVEYRVRVAGFAGARGTFTLHIGPAASPPSNETCATARAVGATLTEMVDTSAAASELDEPAGNCNAGGTTGVQNSVWYSFTSSTGGQLTGTVTDIFGLYDMMAVLYTGTCGSGTLSEVACWDEPQPLDLATPGTGSSLLTAGTPYYLVVGDWGAGAGGGPTNITINVPGGAAANGACCRGTTCAVSAGAACTGANSSYAGNGTVCNVPGNNLTPCCKADFNHVGGVTVQDIFDFLAAYFTSNPQADINGVGGVTVQDIFDYLAAYFAGCA